MREGKVWKSGGKGERVEGLRKGFEERLDVEGRYI